MHHSNHIQTKLIHAGEPEPRIEGSVGMPIFQSSTFEYSEGDDYHDIRYSRLNNTPNHIALHKKLAALDNAEAALVTGSGMAAISAVLLTVLAAGDHVLAQSVLYGGTHSLITHDLPALDIDVDFIDGNNPGSWDEKLQPNTKAIYVESMSNPLLEVADLKAVVEFGQKHGLVTMIDNTFASPFNFRPAEWGFDLTLYSATKYLNGHSDLIAGAVVGRQALIDQVTHKLNHLGGTLDPHACFLLHRGLKTLAVRMRHHNESALKIAQFLEQHPAIDRVNYPGLTSHPHHQRAATLFDGFSGMLSFEPKGGAAVADRLMSRLSLALLAPSLGGVETLITRPATTSHLGLAPEERQTLGISDQLIRLSVGLEATEDLIADFEQALEA